LLRTSSILYCLVFLFIIQTNPSLAQYYVKGQEPASTKWNQITTKNKLKVISPAQADSAAQTFYKYLLESYAYTSERYKKELERVPAIIHPNSIVSNGFVSWAPKRMEVVSTPAPDADPEPWLKTLAFHETQHVAQVQWLNQGFFKVLSYFLGQQAPGAAVGFVPLWFLEGDAVYHETAATNGGRGRDASFFDTYRAHLQSKDSTRFYSYDKWLLGSYNDQIPNHYQFGYLMVGFANQKFGLQVWPNTLNYISKNPFSAFPFYFGLKKQTGLSRKQLFYEVTNLLDSVFSDKLLVEDSNYIKLINKTFSYTNYSFPYLQNDSTLVCLKKNLSSTPTFFLFNTVTGQKRKLHQPGVIIGNVNYYGNYAIWTQYRAHARWEYVNWSEIWVMNLATGNAKRITTKTRYVNPVFYNDTTILAIEQMVNGKSKVIVIDIEGNITASLDVPQGTEPKEIAASNNGAIAVRIVSNEGSSILYFNDIHDTYRELIPKNYRHISNMVFAGNLLLFRMSNNYKNEVFSVNLVNKEIRKLINSTYSIDYISYINDYNIIISLKDTYGTTPFRYKIEENSSSNFSFLLKENGLFQETSTREELSSNIELKVSKPQKYSSFRNAINIHSWAPLYYNPTNIVNGEIDVHPGISIHSQNLTSTITSTIGYSFNKTHGLHASINYTKLFPIFSFGIDAGSEYPFKSGGPNFFEERKDDTRIEADLRVYIPITIASGNFISKLTPSVNYSFSNDYIWNYNTEIYNTINDYLNFSLTHYTLQRLAHKDLRSRLGYFVSGIFSMSPSQRSMIGNTVYIRSGLYLPGILRDQSILIYSQYEESLTKYYLNRSRSSLPRGYNTNIYNKLQSICIDYSLPLTYPDLRIGSLLYIKRLTANAFFDFAEINEYSNNNFNTRQIGSYGLDIYSDTHFFRTRYEFRLGYRIGKNFGVKSTFHQFLLSFNIESIYGFLPMHPLVKFNL